MCQAVRQPGALELYGAEGFLEEPHGALELQAGFVLNLDEFQLRIIQIMSSNDLEWIHMKFVEALRPGIWKYEVCK